MSIINQEILKDLYNLIKKNFDVNFNDEVCSLCCFKIMSKYKIKEINDKKLLYQKSKEYFNKIENDINNLIINYFNSDNYCDSYCDNV